MKILDNQTVVQSNDIKIFKCSKCQRTYFTNPASAVSVIIETPSGIVFVERKFEPKKGYIDTPGGFCEPYEKAEETAVREILEETSIKLDKINFLISGYNEYIYDGVMYITTDIFFYSKLDYIPNVSPNDDASKVILAGVVIGGITPLYADPTMDLNLYVVIAGVIVTVLLAWIGNKILK